SRRIRHGLFFAHLALEKLLKALVCQHTKDLAPRIHNLVRLAESAGLAPNPSQLDLLAEMNQFNIEGRYPGTTLPPPTSDEAEGFMRRTEEVYQWLIKQL
ncbi:MAG: HEPN domain-containing protein, partial [Candidatus Eisenbacteria sp.]|nr:HEPN domain-containing protein [Candidatus Eisenbacteria bacterium]